MYVGHTGVTWNIPYDSGFTFHCSYLPYNVKSLESLEGKYKSVCDLMK